MNRMCKAYKSTTVNPNYVSDFLQKCNEEEESGKREGDKPKGKTWETRNGKKNKRRSSGGSGGDTGQRVKGFE